MDKTSSWCTDQPFAPFVGATRSYVEDPEVVEIQSVDEVSSDELDELFSDDDYDFIPERLYPHTGKTGEPQGSSSDFSPADVDLLNRLIESQFGPGQSASENGNLAQPVSVQNHRNSPLITSEILENVSAHNFAPVQADADVKTLLYHFNGDETSDRRHRHDPRRVKFVYEDPTARVQEEKQPVEPVKAQSPQTLTVPKPTKEKGKSSGISKAADKPAPPGKGKPGKAPKVPIKSPHLDAQLAVVVPPPDPLVCDPPVWQADNQTRVQFHNKKAWIVQKKRRKHWFRLDKLASDGQQDDPDNRPPLWTKSGDRIARQYSLRAVIKNPKTMQLFFFQKKRRYILTALRVFFLFSEQSTRMKLRILSIPGVVRRLVQIITYRAGVLQRLAIMLLSSLSHTKIFIRLFDKADALRKLAPIIRTSRDSDLNIWLSLLIRNISQNKSVQGQFLEMLMVDDILDLVAVRNQEPDVVKYLLQTLYFLCRNRTIRTYLVVRGSFVAINDLMFLAYRYIQYLTFRLLYKLLRTKSEKPIYRFDKDGGMSLLVDFISDITQRKFFPLCIEIFQYVLLAPAIARKMIEKGFYRTLMDRAMNRTYENIDTVQEFALKTVTRAAELEEERRIMHELGYESNVMYLLKSNELKVQVAALQALASLCRRPTNQTTFFDLGAHRVILFIMEGAHSDIREWAFYAIAFLIFRNKNIMNSMVAKGLGDVIYEALLDEKDTWETKGNALLSAILLRKNEQIHQRLRISISGSIPHWLLNANKRIRNYAAVSIGIFVTDDETRQHFAESTGHKALAMACTMSQMQSAEKPELEFMRNLCFGLAALAVDEETVWKLINAGSLTPLWLLKNEADRVSQGYVGLALHRIVALNTFFRYSLLGRIEAGTKLPHGLHDQGVITLANPLRPIEYLLAQGVMGDRTVVYISLPKRYWKRIQTPESCEYRAAKDGLDHLCGDLPTDKPHKRPTNRSKPIGLEQLENSLPPQDLFCYAPYNPDVPADENLKTLLKRARNALHVNGAQLPVQAKLKALADTVVHQMGGSVGSRTGREWMDCVDVFFSFLRRKLNSNCVPISAIEQGNSLHRALLFKVLADVCEVQVTLVRGKSANQGWIEVNHPSAAANRKEICIVDLLYSPGQILPRTSPLARQYTEPPTLPRADGNVAERPNFSTRDVRPLRGVMSQARQQLLQSYAPLYAAKEHPERPVRLTSGRGKLNLFKLTRRFAGRDSASGRPRYRTRMVNLFRNITRASIRLKTKRQIQQTET